MTLATLAPSVVTAIVALVSLVIAKAFDERTRALADEVQALKIKCDSLETKLQSANNLAEQSRLELYRCEAMIDELHNRYRFVLDELLVCYTTELKHKSDRPPPNRRDS